MKIIIKSFLLFALLAALCWAASQDRPVDAQIGEGKTMAKISEQAALYPGCEDYEIMIEIENDFDNVELTETFTDDITVSGMTIVLSGRSMW